MTKDVLVSISGVHMIGNDANDVEVITAGTYYLKKGRHYIIYDEFIEGLNESVKNTIKVGNGTVDIIKSGSTRSHLAFEKDKNNVSCYATPMGQMMVGINTSDIRIDETDDHLLIKIDYTLDVNYEEMSRCTITMDIQSRATAEMHLMGDQA